METLTEQLYKIQPPADWIDHNEVNLADESRYPDSPYFFLLADYQEYVRNGEVQSYRRTVEKIHDASRIEDASLQLQDMCADSQRLIFHGVDIIRNGERFSALEPDNIDVIRRETALEYHITNNQLTVSLSIDDLRVGDLVDFHSTVIGQATNHPLWVKHFYATFWLTWSCPVLLEKVRIVNRSSHTLSLHHHRIDAGQPVDDRALLRPQQEFKREYPELLPKKIADTAPDWWWTDCLQVTRDQSWKQISRYLYRYYTDAGALGADLDIDAIDRIGISGNQRDDALYLIRFVQNDIRYRGQHQGIYTHTPKPPLQVLQKGAGDCKDKSNLLHALLRAIGIESTLVLVNSNYGKGLDNLQPSARHFNHMIVRVLIDDRVYYFDPTMQKQAGDFEHAAQLDYGYALSLTERGEDLVSMPFKILRKVFFLKHQFDFRDEDSDGGILTITREYHAHRADQVRYGFASQNAQRLCEDYLEHARDETSLELDVIAPVSVTKDEAEENVLVTREQYRISDLEKTHGKDRIELSTQFYHLYPEPSDTRFPVLIRADGAGEHRIEIHYPCALDIDSGSKSISNLHFSYLDKIWQEDSVLHFRTLVTPRQQVVEPDEIAQYKSDVEAMVDRSLNCFPHKTGADQTGIEEEQSRAWWQLVGALLILGIAASRWLFD